MNPHRFGRGLTLLLLLASQYPAQTGQTGQGEHVLRSITERLFAAYSAKDEAGWSALWSSRSPYKEAADGEVSFIFGRVERATARIKKIDNLTIEGEQASVDAEIEFDAVSKDARVPAIAYRSGRWTLTFTLENGEWKISQRVSPERRLARRLIAATSDDERERLVKEEPRFSITLLVRGMGDEVGERRPRMSATEEDKISEVAIRVAESSGDTPTLTNALGRYAGRFKDRGNYVKAMELDLRSLELARQRGDKKEIAAGLSAIGLTHLIKNSPSEALVYLKESVQVNDSADSNWVNLYRIGHAYLFLGDYVNAMAYYQRSKDVGKKHNPKDEFPVQNVTIGNLYQLQGDHEQAEAHYTRALSSFQKTGSVYGQAISLAGLAEVYQSLQQHEKAIEFEMKALEMRRSISNYTHIFSSLKRLGINHEMLRNREQALRYFNEALELAKTRENDGQLPEIYLEIAKFRFAGSEFDAALDAALSAKRYREAAPDSGDDWAIFEILGRTYWKLGKVEQAEANFRRAIDIIEKQATQVAGGSTAKEKFFAGMVAAYDDLIQLLIEKRSVEEAFAVSERRRARALLATLANGSNESAGDLTPEELAEDRRLRDELYSLNTQIGKEARSANPDLLQLTRQRSELEKKRLEMESFRTRLYVAKPNRRLHRGEISPAAFTDANAILTCARCAFVEFVVTREKTFVFVIEITAGGRPALTSFTLGENVGQLATAIKGFQSSIASGQLDFQKPSRELYDILLKPAASQLAGTTSLIIVPDGPLWDLPFQALQDEKGKYLAEKMAVSYAPSLTALREMTKKAKEKRRSADAELLAFGNPIVANETSEKVKRVFMSEKMEPLPEAERLVNSLGEMYGANRSKVYTGARASEEIVKTEAPRYRIVQFATHGILNNSSPMYSHLLLATNEKNAKEDGLLEAWELKELDLKADMVILSACDTARGKISRGEGVIGMTWAAFIAGAPTTVASQWKVESSSTTEFMLEFHRQMLANKKISKAEALRQASLKLMKTTRYRHPSYWAPWVLIGDGS